jgi:hypothetical protein
MAKKLKTLKIVIRAFKICPDQRDHKKIVGNEKAIVSTSRKNQLLLSRPCFTQHEDKYGTNSDNSDTCSQYISVAYFPLEPNI